MELFIFDIILGLFLVLGLLLICIGIWVWRYRSGIGPLVLAFSGTTLALPSIVIFIGYIFETELYQMIAWIGWSLGAILLVASLILWRRKN